MSHTSTALMKRNSQGKASKPTTANGEPACDACRAKKVRCGRQQPRCSHCQKNNIKCETTERGRKAHQNDQILSHLEALSSKISRMDAILSRVSATVDNFVPSRLSSPSLRAPIDNSGLSPQVLDPPEIAESRSSGELDRRRTVVEEDYNEFLGSSSLISLAEHAQSVLSKRFAICNATIGRDEISKVEFMKYQDQTWQWLQKVLNGDNNPDFSHDSLGLALPPRALLQDYVDPYFDQIAPVLPFLHAKTFLEGINRIYSMPNSQADPAWISCINNLILLSLNTRARSGNVSKNAMDTGLADIEGILLKNAKRGLARMDDLSEARLINVQALISMCTVSQEYFQLELAEMSLQRACKVAKEMGLHQQSYISSANQDASQIEERRNLFWALFVIDKSMSLVTGNNCFLPSLICNVPLPEEKESGVNREFIARISIARIQEQTYANLYSVDEKRQNYVEHQKTIKHLTHNLQRWLETYKPMIDLGTTQPLSDDNVSDYEITFCYFNTFVMISQQSEDPSIKKQCLESSRKSIKVLKKICVFQASEQGRLRRPFQCFPFAACFVIFQNIIDHPAIETDREDLSILRAAVEVLRDVSHAGTQPTYFSKLFFTVSAIADIAARFIECMENGSSNPKDISLRCLDRPSSLNRSLTSPVPSSQPYSPFMVSNQGSPMPNYTPEQDVSWMTPTSMPDTTFWLDFPADGAQTLGDSYVPSPAVMEEFHNSAAASVIGTDTSAFLNHWSNVEMGLGRNSFFPASDSSYPVWKKNKH